MFGCEGCTTTPVVTEEQWLHARSFLPSSDLYVMKYSNRDDVVKVGRSSNVEHIRRALEAGHAFYIGVVAVFPGYGHIEQSVHQRLDIFKAHGAGREWFNVSGDQAIQATQWFVGQTGRWGPRCWRLGATLTTRVAWPRPASLNSGHK